MLLRRIARLLTCEIEADHSVMTEIHRDLRRLERVGPVPHRANDQPPLHAVLRLAAPKAIEHRADDRIIGQPALAVKARCKAHLRVHHAVVVHVLDELESDTLQRRARLHHPAGVPKAFEKSGSDPRCAPR